MFFKRKNKKQASEKTIEIYRSEKIKKRKRLFFIKEKEHGASVPKHYANELFGRPKKKIYIPYGAIFLIFLVLSGLAYFCLFSDFFKIKNIVVVNNQVLLEGDIVRFLQERNIQNKNLFLLNTEQIKSVLKDYYKRIEEVRVYKVFPAKVKIKIEEKPSSVVWEVGEKKYVLDSNGYVLSEVVQDMQMPAVVDLSGLEVIESQQVVTKNFIDFVNAADESLKKRFGLNILAYSINQTTFELKAHIVSGYYIVFDTIEDIVVQLDKLAKVFQQGENPTEYVILSVDGKVIVK